MRFKTLTIYMLALIAAAMWTSFLPDAPDMTKRANAEAEKYPLDSLSTAGRAMLRFIPTVPPDWSTTYTTSADSIVIVLTGGGSGKGAQGLGKGSFILDMQAFMADSSEWHDFALTGYRFVPGAECAPHSYYAGVNIDGVGYPLASAAAYTAYTTLDSLWFEASAPHRVYFYGGCQSAPFTAFDAPTIRFVVKVPSIKAK